MIAGHNTFSGIEEVARQKLALDGHQEDLMPASGGRITKMLWCLFLLVTLCCGERSTDAGFSHTAYEDAKRHYHDGIEQAMKQLLPHVSRPDAQDHTVDVPGCGGVVEGHHWNAVVGDGMEVRMLHRC